MQKTLIAGLLIAVFSAASSLACTPVHFAPGTSSATVRGIAQSSGDSDAPIKACYTLATGRGQTATLKLIHGPKDDVAFSIHDVVDNHDEYTFKTDPKTYTINVYRTFAREPDEPFTLQIAVK
jgi:hypothetical protein